MGRCMGRCIECPDPKEGCWSRFFIGKVRKTRRGVDRMGEFRMTRIEPPAWAARPNLNITEVSLADYAEILRHRDLLLAIVYQEIEGYLNDPQLYFLGDQQGFPHRDRLTGEYYIGGESYSAYTDP